MTAFMAVASQAASVDALGRNLNTNQQKNPGIVSIEKAKNTVAAKTTNAAPVLAKTYSNPRVEAIKASFNSNTQQYMIGQNKKSFSEYFNIVNANEAKDEARAKYRSSYSLENPSYPYYDNNDTKCTYIYEKNHSAKNMAYDDFATALRILGFDFDENDKLTNDKNDILYNAHGNGYSIFTVTADKPIVFNGNDCSNSVDYNVTNGVKAYNAIEMLKTTTTSAKLSIVNEGRSRMEGVITRHPGNPYGQDISIGNVTATSIKDAKTYNNEAAVIDEYIYNNRVIEFVPYTEDGQKTGAGVSLNAISVAPMDGDFNSLLTNTVSNPRFYENSALTSYPKPEIYNISNLLATKKAYNAYVYVDRVNSYDFAVNDSWGAATISAAMTASLLSKYPFYKWHPEVVKALWLSAGNKDYSVSKNGSPISNKYATTMSGLFQNNMSRYWYGNNEDFFTDEVITFKENVTPGSNYTAAIAWLVRGDYGIENKALSSSYSMRISTPKGALVNYNTSTASYRVSSFRIPNDVSQITVQIKRIKNNANDRVILGYNLHKDS